MLLTISLRFYSPLVHFSLLILFGKIGGFIAPLISWLGSSAGSSLSTGDAMAFFPIFHD